MESIPKSGYFFPNKFALSLIEALEDMMGENGLKAVLNLANLTELVDSFPGDNLNKEFDFSDVSAIGLALEEIYGPRGSRGLALRAGRATFDSALKNFGALAGARDLAFKALPLEAKLRIGLPAMARIFSQMSDQLSTVEEQANEFIYTIHRCPVCWGRSGEDNAVCFIAAGLLQAGLTWISDGEEFRVNESKCHAAGDEVCEFVIQKRPTERMDKGSGGAEIGNPGS